MDQRFNPFQENGTAVDVNLSNEDLKQMPVWYPDKAWAIASMMMPGVTEAISDIEEGLYFPDTPENAKFGMILSNGTPDNREAFENLIVYFAFPLIDLDKALEIVKKRGLTLKPQTGILTMGGDGKSKWHGFEPGLQNTYCLVGHPDRKKIMGEQG